MEGRSINDRACKGYISMVQGHEKFHKQCPFKILLPLTTYLWYVRVHSLCDGKLRLG
jgi:hypothetical protein